MILCTVQFEEVVLRISFERLALTHYWEPWLREADNVVRSMEFRYGGMDILKWGSIGISLQAFKDTIENHFMFPPPRYTKVTLAHTTDTEENAVTLITADGYYASMDEEAVFYDFHIKENDDTQLLETTNDIVCTTSVTSYSGEVVDVPRAVGTVSYQEPLRLNDYSGAPRYHTGYLTGTLGVDYHVYDDGILIDSNVTVGAEGTSGENTFYLNFLAVGKVTISGCGTFTEANNSLKNAIQYLWEARTGSSTVNASYFRSTSDKIGNWATEQKTLRRYISELAASYGHIIRLRDDVFDGLKLEAQGLGSTVEFKDIEILPSVYEDNNGPVATVRSEYIYRYAFTKDDSDTSYPYSDVKEDKIEVSSNYSIIYTGTTTAETQGTLTDSGFLSKSTDFYGGDLVRSGMYAVNETKKALGLANHYATVIDVISDEVIILNKNLFLTGNTYSIGYKFDIGDNLSVPTFSIDAEEIKENLNVILTFLHCRQIAIKVPMEDDPNLDYGDRIAVVERQRYIKPLTIGYGKVIGKIYDFGNELIIYTIVGTAYTEEPRIIRVDFTTLASCMGSWLMNSISLDTEYDRSGKQENLTIVTDSDGEIDRLTDELPDNFNGFYKHFSASDTEYMYVADGGYTDISGANQELSIFIRFRITAKTDENMYLVSKSSAGNIQYSIYINNADDKVYCVLSSDGSTTVTAFTRREVTPNSGWQSIGVVYNDTDIRIYLNGLLDSNSSDNPKSYTSGIYDGGADFVIASNNKVDSYFNGDIYEIGVWDEELSASEILLMHNAGIKGDYGLYEKTVINDTVGWDYTSFSTCLAAWFMNGTDGTELDRSGNNETLTCNSADSDGVIDRGNTNLPDGFTGYYRTFRTADTEYMQLTDSTTGVDIGGAGVQSTVFIRFKYFTVPAFSAVLIGKGDSDSGGVLQFSFLHFATGLSPSIQYILRYGGADNTALTASFEHTLIYDTEWHTLCGTYDGEKIKLYIDGVLKRVEYGEITVNECEGPLTVGGTEEYPSTFNGDIYEIGVWQECFNAYQVLQLHRFGVKGDQGDSE